MNSQWCKLSVCICWLRTGIQAAQATSTRGQLASIPRHSACREGIMSLDARDSGLSFRALGSGKRRCCWRSSGSSAAAQCQHMWISVKGFVNAHLTFNSLQKGLKPTLFVFTSPGFLLTKSTQCHEQTAVKLGSRHGDPPEPC